MNKTRLLISAFLAAGFVTDAFGITKKKFDFVVGVDGDFKAAVAAAAAAKPTENNRFVMFFPDGEYDITKLTGDTHGKSTFSTSFVSLIGQTRDKAIIANKTDTEGISLTATLYFPNNNGMYMQDLTIQNKSSYATSSAARQVTIQHKGDKYIFKNVRLLSGQDTYYTNGTGRVYWEGGEIQGTVDFICGDGDVWFEGTNLVMTRNGGYITAAKTSTSWGYVFNNSKINVSNGSYNGTFYLGRSWGHAKTVFLNTTMYAQPKAEGWGPDMNSGPDVFGEYNSKNGNGGAIDVSRRKTSFDGGKDASTAKSLKTVWNASDASKYTLANVLGGSDKWEPNKLTVQMGAPKISQDGADIVWADDENALNWVVFVNGKYHANVIQNSIDVGNLAPGSKVTVRAANSMGGLGATSNEIAVVESNVTYYNVKINNAMGGSIVTSLSGNKVAEGKTVSFTAKANDGWKFSGWTGASASAIDASNATAEIKATGDIELTANFTGAGTGVFQAEDGAIENAVYESSNAGFAGSGYVNFGAGAASFVNIPVYVDAAGEYTMEMFYANGSSAARSLAFKCLGNEAGEGAGDATEKSFDKTGAWTTYPSMEATITLPRGKSYIQFATVGGNDGPNLDQIKLTPLNVEKIENPGDTSDEPIITDPENPGDSVTTILAQKKLATSTGMNVQFFNLQGKLMSTTQGKLPAGIYLMKVSAPGYKKQSVVRIK
ncbi:MAG: pectinesterase family protein [Fibrobacter sp.]|nr:pectinesterase family protein [Fibrobacter sp.]